jgi:lysozyme
MKYHPALNDSENQCMKCFDLLVIFLAAMLNCGSTFAGEFNRPWDAYNSAIVIDPYEGNSIDWDLLAQEKKLVGIIHRASIGMKADKQYAARRDVAKNRGYLWGSYHLGLPGNPIEQADFYLSTIGDVANEVIALDIETLDTGKSISLMDAKKFIMHVKQKTGRFPLVYANGTVAQGITASYSSDPIFSKSPLWYARFRSSIVGLIPAGVWNTYEFWQFSSEVNCKAGHEVDCLYRVPGTKSDMDVNVYNGSITQLKSRWPLTVQK